jgi:hypothetical protein
MFKVGQGRVDVMCQTARGFAPSHSRVEECKGTLTSTPDRLVEIETSLHDDCRLFALTFCFYL